MTNNKIIEELLRTMDEADAAFIDALPAIQKESFGRVIKIIAELDLRADGSIRTSVKNLKLISKIKQEMDSVLFSKQYQKSLFDLTKTFDKIADLQGQYFTNISSTFTTGGIYEEIKKQSIDIVSEQLGKQALSSNISGGVRNILSTNITSGAKFNDMVEQMRTYLTDTKSGAGALTRYAKVYTTDALNQFSASYDQLATDDLGLEWYSYYGSLKKTSREFCRHLVEAKDKGMPYIHRSQFQTILNGNINGEQVHINDKTDLPDGLKEGTTPANFQILRGGWSCQHLLKPTPSAIVPKELRAKFEGKF